MKNFILKPNNLFKLLAIGYLIVFQQNLYAQCNPTMLYDKIVSGYHSSAALDTNGNYNVWGQSMDSSGSNDLLSPQILNVAHYPRLKGNVLKVTVGGVGSGGNDQYIALSDTGLYAWSTTGEVLSTSLTSSTHFAHIKTPTNGDPQTALPIGVTPSNVLMLFATYKTLTLVTADTGYVYVMTIGDVSLQGDNSTLSSTTWHKVKTNATTYLKGVTAIRGQYSSASSGALMAVTSTGQVYTWGPAVYLGDGSGTSSKKFATLMTIPSEFGPTNVPRMIAVTGGTGNTYSCLNTYYLVSSLTGYLYTMGDNTVHQCGDYTGTNTTAGTTRLSWVTAKRSSGSTDTLKNILSIYAMSHDGSSASPGLMAISDTGDIYTWGYNNKSMLGHDATYNFVDPSTPRGFTPGTDKGLYAEVGGHTGVYLKRGYANFCYSGHFVSGSAGNGSSANSVDSVFDCSSTPLIGICGGVVVVASTGTSSISASPTSIAADGISTSTITVQLLTAGGAPLTKSGGTVMVYTTAGSLGSVTDNNDGTYTVILTSSNTAATATLSFSIIGVMATNTTTVNFASVSASTATSTITALPTSIAADGVSTSTITVQLKSAGGADLITSGGTVTMGTNAGSLGTVTDNGDGTYTATLTSSNTVSTATLNFSINGTPATHTATVNFIATVGSTVTSTISALPTSIPADGVSTSTITVQLETAGGTNLTGSAGTVSISTNAGTIGSVTDNEDGTYTATLTSTTTVTTATLNFSINGTPATHTATVDFTALVGSTLTSTISSDQSSITANGSSTATITVQLETAGGIDLTASGGTVVIATNAGTVGSTTDNGDGTYTATLTSSNTVTTATLSFSINGTPATNTTTVNFTPIVGSVTTSTISATPTSILADGTSTSTITIQLETDGGVNLTTSGGTVTLSTSAGTVGSVTDNEDGTYTATLTSSNTVATATLTFSINGTVAVNQATVNFTDCSPQVTADPAGAIGCTGSTVGFSVTATGIGLNYKWQENQGAGFTDLTEGGVYSGVATSTLTLTEVTTDMSGYSYRCVVSNACSPSTQSASAILTVNPVPSSTGITNSGTICNGGTVTLSDNSSNATAWSWTGSDGTSSSLQSPAMTPTSTTTYSLSVSSNGIGCSPSDVYTTTVTVNLVPTSSGVTNSGDICVGGTVTLSDNSSNATAWSWTGSDGTSSSLQSPSMTPTVTTTYSLTVSSVGDGCSPTDVYVTTVTVKNVPSSSGPTNSGPICVGGSVWIHAHSSDATSWSWVGSDGFIGSAPYAHLSPTVTSTYSLTVSSVGSGCQPETIYTTMVTVKNVPTSSGPTNSGPICVGGTVWLHAHSSDATEWSWVGSDGFTASTVYAHETPTVTTTYSLTVASSGSGCHPETIYTTTVTVNQVPTSTGTTNSGPICVGGTVTLNDNSSYATSWTWVGSDATSSTLQSPVMSPTATTTYSLTVSSVGNGCHPATIYTTTVTVKPDPTLASANNNGPICAGTTLNLTVTDAENVTDYLWTGPVFIVSATSPSASVPSATTASNSIFTVTVHNGLGSNCVATYTTAATVSPVPTLVSATNNGPICAGADLNLGVNFPLNVTGYVWTGPATISSSTSASATVSAATTDATGIYTVTVNNGDGIGCTATYTTSATVKPAPVLTSANNDGPLCIGATLNLSVTGAENVTGYLWTGPVFIAGAGAASASVSVVTSFATGIYSVTVNNGTGVGCAATYTTSVTVNPVPTITSANNSGPICAGTALNLSVTGASNVTGYSWTGPVSVFNSSLASASVPETTTAANGIYTLTVNDGTGAGCTASYTTAATVSPYPSLESANSNSPVCASTTLNLSVTGASNVTGYLWTGPVSVTSATTASATVPAVTTAGNGIYTVTINNGSGAGCVATYTTAVTVNNLPVSSGATNGGAICVGGTASLNANSTNATAWAWRGSNGFTSTLQNPTDNPTSTTTYSLTVSSVGSGCNPGTVYTTTVVVKNVPASTGITNSGPICDGGTVNLNANSNSSATAWVWNGSDGFNSTTHNPTATPTVTTTYSLTVSGVGSGCQPETIYTTSVTVKNVPGSTGPTATGPICVGAATNLSSNSTDATQWIWIGSDGFISFSSNPTDHPTTTTTYTLTVGSTGSGCHPTTAYTTTVVVNQVPVSGGATNSSPICVGGSLMLNANSSYATSWTWTGSDGFTSSEQNPSETPTVTTTYSLTVSSDGIGCQPSTVYVTVATVNNVPSSTGATNSGPICFGGSAVLSSNSSDATSWVWMGSDGFSSSVNNPVATPTATTTYSLTVSSIGDGCNPETVYTTSITVNPQPQSTGITNNGPICYGFTATLSANSTNASAWTWVGSDGFSSTEQNPDATPTVTTTYSLTVSSGSASGCSPDSVYTSTVVVNPLPGPIAGMDSLCSGLTTVLSDTGGGIWSSGSVSVATIDEASGLVSGLTMGTSIITYTLPTTCITTVVMTINPSPAIPVITTHTPSSICADAYFQNFGISTAPVADEHYTWTVSNGEIMALGHANQYCIINFSTPGASAVTLTATTNQPGCVSTNTYNLNVDGTPANNPEVIYTNNMFICLLNSVSSYQWGYDDAYSLDSSKLDGEINQTYLNASPDWAHKYYWVMTTDQITGCVKKGYYLVPTGITNVNEPVSTEMKVYPNPADAFVNVEIHTTGSGKMNIQVYNLLGQEVNSVPVIDNKAGIDVTSLPAGCYIVVCYQDGIKTATARFIKN